MLLVFVILRKNTYIINVKIVNIQKKIMIDSLHWFLHVTHLHPLDKGLAEISASVIMYAGGMTFQYGSSSIDDSSSHPLVLLTVLLMSVTIYKATLFCSSPLGFAFFLLPLWKRENFEIQKSKIWFETQFQKQSNVVWIKIARIKGFFVIVQTC